VPRSELCSTTGVSKEAKPAKIDSLKEKGFCARPLKEKEIFAGFVRRQAASRWGGFLPVRAEILVQKRFELRSAIATILLRPSAINYGKGYAGINSE